MNCISLIVIEISWIQTTIVQTRYCSVSSSRHRLLEKIGGQILLVMRLIDSPLIMVGISRVNIQITVDVDNGEDEPSPISEMYGDRPWPDNCDVAAANNTNTILVLGCQSIHNLIAPAFNIFFWFDKYYTGLGIFIANDAGLCSVEFTFAAKLKLLADNFNSSSCKEGWRWWRANWKIRFVLWWVGNEVWWLGFIIIWTCPNPVLPLFHYQNSFKSLQYWH